MKKVAWAAATGSGRLGSHSKTKREFFIKFQKNMVIGQHFGDEETFFSAGDLQQAIPLKEEEEEVEEGASC